MSFRVIICTHSNHEEPCVFASRLRLCISINSIKPLPQRRDVKGNDTFTLLNFWRANEGEVPAFAYVLRAVLANAPNSIPPERVFSVLNNTFDDDMANSLADYIELSLQLQFNSRSR